MRIVVAGIAAILMCGSLGLARIGRLNLALATIILSYVAMLALAAIAGAGQ